MRIEIKHPEDHKRYLAEVPKELFAEQMERFRLKIDVAEPLPPICGKEDIVRIDTRERQWKPFIRILKPRTLDDLKEWIGVPNRIAAKNKPLSYLRDLQMWKLPTESGYSFKSLDNEQREAVTIAANSLLFGVVDEKEIKRAPIAALVDLMLERLHDLPLLLADDLIVCPGKTVTFTGPAALYFNNVLVYGDGAIHLPNQSKLHTHAIRRVTNWT